MPIDLTVPQWLKHSVATWSEILCLTPEWDFEIELSTAPDGDTGNRALHHSFGNLNFTRLTFRADIQDDDDGHMSVIHELLHVRYVRVDLVVQRVIMPELPDAVTGMARNAYEGVMEPFIEKMTKVLYDLHRGSVTHV